MPGRTFRFQPLLDARRRDEVVCQARYVQCHAEAEAVRCQGEELDRLVGAARVRAFADPEHEGVQAWQGYAGVLERQARAARQQAGELGTLACEARDELLRASRARAALELLRDRHRAAAARASRAAEERERDDWSTCRATQVR
jgi:flagellar export protein FliJ